MVAVWYVSQSRTRTKQLYRGTTFGLWTRIVTDKSYNIKTKKIRRRIVINGTRKADTYNST